MRVHIHHIMLDLISMSSLDTYGNQGMYMKHLSLDHIIIAGASYLANSSIHNIQ